MTKALAQRIGFDGYLLRPVRLEECVELHQAIRDSVASVGPWLSWCHANYSLDEARLRVERDAQHRSEGKAFEFGIFELATNRLAGMCGVNCIVWPNGTANLGYWIREGFSGRGIASQAVRCLARFGFELGLTRIEIVADENNIASRRVAEKSGAVFEALLRNRLKTNGKPVPGALYALFPD